MKALLFPAVDARTATIRVIFWYAVTFLSVVLSFSPWGAITLLTAPIALVFLFHYSVQDSLEDDGLGLAMLALVMCPSAVVAVLVGVFA